MYYMSVLACWLAAAHYLTLWDKRHFGASAPLSKKYKYTSGTHKKLARTKRGAGQAARVSGWNTKCKMDLVPLCAAKTHFPLAPHFRFVFVYVFTFFALQQHSLIMTPFLMTKRHTLSKGKGRAR
jgi:hypothetical protein